MSAKKQKAVETWEDVEGLKNTGEVLIPSDPIDRVLGQEEAIALAKIAAVQRRNLLLVGPPGTGKSMIARAISMNLPKAKSEIRIAHNPENPERPFLEVLDEATVRAEASAQAEGDGKLRDPETVPVRVAEKLGYRCPHCNTYSLPTDLTCPNCGKNKVEKENMGGNPFNDIMSMIQNNLNGTPTAGKERVNTTHVLPDGTEETVVFERAGNKIRELNTKALQKRNTLSKNSNVKTIVPIDRQPFVMATGASETELLGDVRHDPYGGHEKIGTPAYQRVIPGAIHEAHEGVLFVDEISHLGPLQRFILTAMQDKQFPITGRNPQSSGASVKVDAVPCDFILVAACNMQDLQNILSPLRSRILGNGYEVLVDVAMPDNSHNRAKYAQFVAQEISMDGHIPHATIDAVEEVIAEGRKRARLDNQMSALTLRLRELGGLIRAAGDIAVMEKAKYITADHVKRAVVLARPVEEQIKSRYGSYQKGISTDISDAQKQNSQNYIMESSVTNDDSMFG